LRRHEGAKRADSVVPLSPLLVALWLVAFAFRIDSLVGLNDDLVLRPNTSDIAG
jgi:hypothetical protein